MNKRRWFYHIASVILAFLLGTTGAVAVTVTKGLISKEDINLTQTDGATAETFTRAASTGATLTLTKLNGTHIPWDNAYTRTIRPKTITGGGTGNISGYDNITITGKMTSATAAVSGAATIGSTLAVTGAAVFSSSVASDSLSTGAGTFSGDVNANGNVVVDNNTVITGMAQIDVDTLTFDTMSAAPSSGTWVKGDFVFNSAPTAKTTIAATGAIGWRCTTGGTPGTWEAVFPVFVATPDNAAMTCTAGMVAIDNAYIYNCYVANTWLRVGMATW